MSFDYGIHIALSSITVLLRLIRFVSLGLRVCQKLFCVCFYWLLSNPESGIISIIPITKTKGKEIPQLNYSRSHARDKTHSADQALTSAGCGADHAPVSGSWVLSAGGNRSPLTLTPHPSPARTPSGLPVPDMPSCEKSSSPSQTPQGLPLSASIFPTGFSTLPVEVHLLFRSGAKLDI